MSLIEIDDPQNERYATLKLIPWWDQKKLSAAKVMVVGVGALGNEVLKNLALLGVGYIFLSDFDTVEAANLTRAVLFRAADKGRRKVEVAAERLREINPDVRVAAFHGDVTTALGDGIFRGMDVVFGCVDNKAARLAVNRACWRVGTPWIDGGLDVLMGQVSVFVPPHGACYECTLKPEDYELLHIRYSCPMIRPDDLAEGRMLTTPTSASITAAWQVQEALRLLHGFEVPAGCYLYINGHTHTTNLVQMTPREGCLSHRTYPHIIELPFGANDLTAGALLDEAAQRIGGSPALLLDQDVVAQFVCEGCGRAEAVYRPFDEVVPDGVPCPHCKAQRVPALVGRVGRGSGAAGVPLRQLGIPPLHIVRLTGQGHTHYLELSGDRKTLLRAWEAHLPTSANEGKGHDA